MSLCLSLKVAFDKSCSPIDQFIVTVLHMIVRRQKT